MPAIERGRRAIQVVVLRDHDPQRLVASMEAGRADALPERVRRAERVTLEEPALHHGLERVVAAVADGTDFARRGSAAELLEQLASSVALADVRPVQFAVPELPRLPRGDVSGLSDPSAAQLPLNSDVPRGDVAALQIERHGLRRDVQRYRDDPVSETGGVDRRNAVGER